MLDEVELSVSKLATNAVVHAGTEFVLRVAVSPSGERVEVADGDSHTPVPRNYAATSRTGRGLRLVEQSVDRWGVSRSATGKAVWFEIGQPCDVRSDVVVGEEARTLQEPSGAVSTSVSSSTDAQVRLLNVPILMHWTWQEHAQALLREYLLFKLEEDPSVLDEHAMASEGALDPA